jgi:hypothetical protein
MIQVAMRDEQLFQRHPLLRHGTLEQIQIATGIGQRAAHGFCAPDQRAILLKRRDGDDGGFKGLIGHECEMGMSGDQVNRRAPYFAEEQR